jgi:pimeloyl-ACP methyl ester carboxylesterase
MAAEPELRFLHCNGIEMSAAVAGQGPLVVLCHGWPESWRSWRHQLGALAGAGYRVVAPDMRGYGLTEAPGRVEAYTILHLVADMVGLVEVLGEKQARIIGHDWGAYVAWHCALLRPDMFTAVAGMSVPYSPPSRFSLLDMLDKLGIRNSYLHYFQKTGVAEALFDRNVELALLHIIAGAAGDASATRIFGLNVSDDVVRPSAERPALPPWLAPADFATLAESFRRKGFRGPLNWYRNMRRNAELLAPWRGRPVTQPALFIAGSNDFIIRFPVMKQAVAALPRHVPGLAGSVLIDGAGHWIQQERAAEVSALLVDFLGRRPAKDPPATRPDARLAGVVAK